MSSHIPWDPRKDSDTSSNNARSSPTAGPGASAAAIMGTANTMNAGVAAPVLQSCSFCRKRKIKYVFERVEAEIRTRC